MKFVINKRLAGKTPKHIIKLAAEICAEQSDGEGERIHVWLYDAVTLKVGGKLCFAAFFELVSRARIAIATQNPPDAKKCQHEPMFAQSLYHEIMHAKQWSSGKKISEPNARRWAMRQTNNRFGEWHT